MHQQYLDDSILKALEERMRPGGLSNGGFLGPNESLSAVLDGDAKYLNKVSIEPKDLSDRLEAILVSAMESKGSFATTDHKVRTKHYKGFQRCPFEGLPCELPSCAAMDKRLASIDWTIINTRNRARISGPGLIVHLIGAHSFFEGIDSPYRVPPQALIELLEGAFSKTVGPSASVSDSNL